MPNALERLENALILEERASFHLVLCPARLELDHWLARLETLLNERRMDGVTLRRLDPYHRLQNVTHALSEDDMVETILQPLLAPHDENHHRSTLYVVDASLLHPRDEACWRWVFRRMNELRNRTMKGLNHALILAGIPQIEILFAEQAPDFWSIRTGEAWLPTQPRPIPSTRMPPEQLLQEVLGMCAWPMEAEHTTYMERASNAVHQGDLGAARSVIETLVSRLQEAPVGWSLDIAQMLEIFLAIEDAIQSGGTRTNALKQQAKKLRELPWGMTGTEMILAEQSAWFLLLLAESAEALGEWESTVDWYENAFERFFSHWSGGVIGGSESWIIRACLGAFRTRVHRQELPTAQKWLWAAEAILSRAPWWSSSTPQGVAPRLEDYSGLSVGYALLGHEARSRHFAREAEEHAHRAPPTEPLQILDSDWSGEYFMNLIRTLPGGARRLWNP